MKKQILMIHGMFVDNGIWDKYKHFFEKKGYEVFAPTLRYHDCSIPDERLGEMSLNDYADDLMRLIDDKMHKPILFGHSMGGLLAQKIAEKRDLEALVLINSAAPAGLGGFSWKTMKAFLYVLGKGKFWKKPIKPSFSNACKYHLYNMDEKQQKVEYDKWLYESGRTMFEIGMWPLDRKKAATVGKIGCPALVISGGKDIVIPSDVQKSIAKKYNAELKVFDDHSHPINTEKGWEIPAEFIDKWLKRL